MRKAFSPNCWLYPMPVLIVGTYDEKNRPCAMNAAWGGIYDTNMVMLCLAQDHKTTENIRLHKAFTVSFATEDTAAACDYVGIVSAKDVPDKCAKAGFTAEESPLVHAPLLQQLPMAVECILSHFTEDGICVGKIVGISADESIIGADGKPDRELLRPLSFDPVRHSYYAAGADVAKAFSVGKTLL